ncbi:MAG: NAD-binding protein [Lachnospiraceae bacterium]|nr:NAD-binding protein [Lachnospiraceae bacterium]
MKIIVVGLGEAGWSLISLREGSGHDITVIDKNRDRVEAVTDRFCVSGVTGSGASEETLLKAGAGTADILIALTHTDEINLISCMQAKAVGTRLCAARLLMPDLVKEEEEIKKKYGIDLIVKPKVDIAGEIHRNIGLPGYVKLERCADTDLYVIDLNAVGSSPLIGATVASIQGKLAEDAKISVVVRGKRSLKLSDDLEIRDGDTLYIVVGEANLNKVLKALSIKRDKTKDVVIVGGHTTGIYLIERLLADHMKITVVDDDIDRCRNLMDRFPSVNVIYAEGDITEVLEQEKVEKADAVVSLTDDDDTNLVISMYAWSKGIYSVLTRVDKQVHVKLLHKVNIDITVSPTEYSVFGLIRFITTTAHEETDPGAQIVELIRDMRKF